MAIARFRLWVAALQVAGCTRLSHAPNFRVHVAIGDSLLHGTRIARHTTADMFGSGKHYAGTGLAHAYASEDLAAVEAILGRQYHAVVGNPPYVVVKDAALNAAYRQRYASCHMKYSLGAPFTERCFELALRGDGSERQPAGYVGLITTNSFMKREFGARLIEQVLPQLDLTHVIDTAGAYIPGHGTPTVILLGRHQPPVAGTVRTVMGIKGEPRPPADPAQGQVWTAILTQLDQPGSQSEFVSVVDTPRPVFGRHPWSVGGGGAAELRELIQEPSDASLGSFCNIGIAVVTLEDDAYQADSSSLSRYGIADHFLRRLVVGDSVRDWGISGDAAVIFPHTAETLDPEPSKRVLDLLWPLKTNLSNRQWFKKT